VISGDDARTGSLGPTVKRTIVASRGETAKPARLPSNNWLLFPRS